MISSHDISPNERKVLDEFIQKNEQKRRGVSIVSKGKSAIVKKMITNCNGIRKIDQERKKHIDEAKKQNMEDQNN